MATVSTEQRRHLNDAINRVNELLGQKDQIWTAGDAATFQNFDIQRDLGIHPIQFGVAMTALKLNRMKARIRGYTPATLDGMPVSDTTDWKKLSQNKDAEDCMVDLACYAILTLGMMLREQRNGS